MVVFPDTFVHKYFAAGLLFLQKKLQWEGKSGQYTVVILRWTFMFFSSL